MIHGMSRRTLVSLALVFFGVAAAAVVSLVVVRGISEIREERLLRYTLADVDQLLVQNRYQSAADELDAFRGSTLDGEQWLSVLRRAYVLSRELPEWTGFAELSGRAASRHGDNSELVAVAVYARHRAGEVVEPAEVPTGARYDGLRAALMLRHGGTAEVQDDAVSALLGAATNPTAGALQAAYNASGDARFAVDAVLKRLEMGSTEAAFEKLPRGIDSISRTFQARVALSAGEFDAALELLSAAASSAAASSPDRAEFLRGDAYLGLGDFGAAWQQYTALGRREWMAETFQSAAYLERVRGNAPEDTLRRGLENNPDDPELARALAVEIADARPQQARRLLERVQGESERARLSHLVLFELPATTDRVRGTLWKLYNESESPEIGAYLAWYLAGLSDWDDLIRVIRDGDESWTRFYRAVMNVHSGDLAAARRDFEVIDAPDLAISAQYNMARISLHSGELDRAADGFAAAQEALERLPQSQKKDKRLSRVLEARGRVHLLKGELQTGYRMLSQAIEYDPGNASARNRLQTGSSQR